MASIDHYELLIDWSNNGIFSDAEIIFDTDIVGGIDLQQGMNFGSSRHGRLVAGRLSISILDENRVYDPTNPGSPRADDLLPGRSVALVAVQPDGAKVVLWAGQTVGFVPIVARNRPRLTRLTAYGISARLNTPVDVRLAHSVKARDAARRVLAAADIRTDILASDDDDMVIGIHGGDESATRHLRRLEGSTMGLFYEGFSGGYQPLIALVEDGALSASKAPSLVISLNSENVAGAVTAEYYRAESNSRGISNRIIVQATIGVVSTGDDRVPVIESETLEDDENTGTGIFRNERDYLMYFGDLSLGERSEQDYYVESLTHANGTTPITAFIYDQLGFSNWGNEIDNEVEPFYTFNDLYGATTCRPILYSIEDEPGEDQRLRFRFFNPWSSNWPSVNDTPNAGHQNDPQELRIVIDFEVPYWKLQDYEVVRNDSDSQALYGVVEDTILAFSNDQDAADDLAEEWLDRYSEVQLTHTLTYDATNDSSVIAPRFDDRVRIIENGQSIGDFAVRGIGHRITQGGRCTVSLTLVPATTYVAP